MGDGSAGLLISAAPSVAPPRGRRRSAAQPGPVGKQDELRAVPGVLLGEQVAHVRLRRRVADHQPIDDLDIGQSEGDRDEHLVLALCQGGSSSVSQGAPVWANRSSMRRVTSGARRASPVATTSTGTNQVLWGAFAVLAPLRIFWHLPLTITGDMPLVIGLLGNAGFQLIVRQMMRHRGGAWTHAAVWHAMLNAFGGAFFFTMVTGADKDRLGTLLALVHVFVALLTLVPALLRRGRDDQDPTAVAPSMPAPPRPGVATCTAHGRWYQAIGSRAGVLAGLGVDKETPEADIAAALAVLEQKSP